MKRYGSTARSPLASKITRSNVSLHRAGISYAAFFNTDEYSSGGGLFNQILRRITFDTHRGSFFSTPTTFHRHPQAGNATFSNSQAVHRCPEGINATISRCPEGVFAAKFRRPQATIYRCPQAGTAVHKPQMRFLFTDDAHKHPPAPVVRPSITWGIVGDKEAQKEGRQKVLDYLKAEGINTDEFDSVELPTSIDVMAERLEFIKNLGLEKVHINEYPLIVCCSVKKNMVPVINYLEALGFTPEDLTKLLRRYPMVLHSSVTIDIQPVVIYLMGLGISRVQIPRVLVKYPEMLGYRLEGTMSTSVAYLVSIGVHIRSISRVLTRVPEILGMRVGNNIKPKVDYLCSLGMPREAVGKILENHPYILKYNLDDMKERVNILVKYGVSGDGLPAVILQHPDILVIHFEKKIIQKRDWMQKAMKIPHEDFPRVLEKMPQILGINHEYAMQRVKFFVSKKFKLSDIGKMVVKCPQILVIDVRVLKDSMEFFEKQMKRDIKELVEFPAYFTYGLEERIRFRYRRISERNLNFSLAWMLNCSNAAFNERITGSIPEPKKLEKEFVMGGPVEQLNKPIEEASQQEEYETGEDNDDEVAM